MKQWILLLGFLITTSTLWAQGRFTANKEPAPPKYGTALFHSMEGIYFDLENDYNQSGVSGYLNIMDWLQGRVAGMQVYTIRGTRVPFIRNYPTTIYVDEIRTDASFLNALPVADIALIKIMKTPGGGIMSGPGGAIVIYTKKGEGDEEEEEIEK